jgi:hypothetical protein
MQHHSFIKWNVEPIDFVNINLSNVEVAAASFVSGSS